MSTIALSPVASGPTEVAIDQIALLAHCMNNVQFAASLLAELELTGEQKVRDIVDFADAGDFQAMAQVAHGLKGAASIIAAEPLRCIAAAIEEAGKSETQGSLVSIVDNLQLEMKKCLDFCKVFREQTSA